jgi:hypothetical protein
MVELEKASARFLDFCWMGGRRQGEIVESPVHCEAT